MPSEIFFTGVVKFSIDNKSLNNNIPDQVFNDIIGQTMIGIVGANKYKVLSINSLNDTTVVLYDLKGLKIYYNYPGSDTIFWRRLDQTPGELISIRRNQKPQKEILGEIRESVTIIYQPDDEYIDRYEGTYFFNTDHKLDKKIYAGHKDSFWNMFVDEAGSISIRNEIFASPLYSSVYEAYEIIERDVSEDEFEMDKNKVIAKEN